MQKTHAKNNQAEVTLVQPVSSSLSSKNGDPSLVVMIRPKQVRERYGIPTSTLCGYCTDPDPTRRLPSLKLPGRKGHKGSRLIRVADLEAWLARWETSTDGRAA